MKTTATQFAEYVSPGHPDRLADAVAERIVEFAQSLAVPGTACRNLVGVEVANSRQHRVYRRPDCS